MLNTKFALKRTGPYKIVAVGPCPSSDTPDGSPLGDKLLYLGLPTDMSGVDAHRRVSVERCKPCTNPHDGVDMPKELPDGLTQYVLNRFTKKSPPHHVTQDDPRRHVGAPPAARGGEDDRHGHQSLRGGGGDIAVMYEMRWPGLSRPSWEREMDLQLPRPQILLYWTGTRNQFSQTNRLYRQMRIWAAQLELSRANGKLFLAPGYDCASRAGWFRYCSTTVLPNGVHSWYEADDGLWWLGKTSARTTTNGEYLVRFLDDPGPIKLPLSPAHYTT